MVGVGKATGGGMTRQMMRGVLKDVTRVVGMGWLSMIVDPTGCGAGVAEDDPLAWRRSR
jgi:hypothetical protein